MTHRQADGAALLIEKGYRVIPVKPASKEPAISGWRVPGFAGLTLEQLEAYDGFGVGVLTGGPFFVVDVDDWSVWEDVCRRHGWTPSAPPGALGSVRTPSGGRHFYFRAPEGTEITNKNTFPEGIDVRGEGGFVVAPPTKGYVWV